MSKKKSEKIQLLPNDTIVEVISNHNGQLYKKCMPLEEAQKYYAKDPSKYQIFQKGYSSFKNVIEKK